MASVSSTIAQAVVRTVSTGAVTNVSLPTANTEVSIALGSTTKVFTLQNRNEGLVKLSFTSGQSGTTYFSIWPGNKFEKENLSGSAVLNLYVQSPKASQTLELVEWS